MTEKQKNAENFIIKEVDKSPFKETFYNEGKARLQAMKYYAHYYGSDSCNANDEQYMLYAKRIVAYDKGDALDKEVYKILLSLIEYTGMGTAFKNLARINPRTGKSNLKLTAKDTAVSKNVDCLICTSVGVLKLIDEESVYDETAWKNFQFVKSLLLSLNSIKNHAKHIKNISYNLRDKTRCLKISTSGEAKRFFTEFSSILSKTPKNKYEYPFCIFVYKGNLERKVKNMKKESWDSLCNDDNLKDIICFYNPFDSENAPKGINTDKYVCNTLREVLDKSAHGNRP